MPLGSLWMYASTTLPLSIVIGVWVMISWFMVGLVKGEKNCALVSRAPRWVRGWFAGQLLE